MTEDWRNKRKHIALDYDGTIVGNAWPGHGKPEPHAAEVIKRLMQDYDVTIFTARIAPFDMDGNPRQGKQVATELRDIHNKLKRMGLGYMEIHQMPWKIGADLYVDDKAVHYAGDWHQTEREIKGRLFAQTVYEMAGLMNDEGDDVREA